ncbi:hypothetical protein GGI12_001427 [Dipsacomyces acuminosporus]|nr:hypothetical protein GGI12_001427 [Dipsacomyces acuminosporus]
MLGPGDTVEWVNNMLVPGTVTSGDDCRADGKFESDILKFGERFNFTFTEKGVFPYFNKIACDIRMEGVVVVR